MVVNHDARIKDSLALKSIVEASRDYDFIMSALPPIFLAYVALAIYTMVIELLLALVSIYEALRITKEDSKVGAHTV